MPALLIHRHARPVVRRALLRPRILRPRVITKLARMRNRVKAPAQFSRAHIVRANIARRRRQRSPAFRPPTISRSLYMTPGVVSATDCCAGSRPRSSRRSIRPSSPEARDRLARLRIQRVNKTPAAAKSAGRPLRPISDPAIRSAHIEPGIELPQQFPVPASSAITRCFGVFAYSTPPTMIGLVCNPPGPSCASYATPPSVASHCRG